MAFSLRGPVYEWPTGRTDRVTYDRYWGRALHFPDDKLGFYYVDLHSDQHEDASTHQKSRPSEKPAFLPLIPTVEDAAAMEVVTDARFAPDDHHIAYVVGNQIFVTNRLDVENGAAPIALLQKWAAEAHYEVLAFFWSPTAVSLELVAVSTCGIEIFKVKSNIKSARTYQTLARRVWVEPRVGLMVCCIGARTLQPFDLRPRRTPQKLPKFDLYIGKSKAIEHFDVNVLTLYGETYCVHLDVLHGKVSLRNISDARKSTPENDIVLSVLPYPNVDLLPDGIVPGQPAYFLGPPSAFAAAALKNTSTSALAPSGTTPQEELAQLVSPAPAGASSASEPLDVPSETARGPLRISVVDDLLLVHRVDRGWSWVFDVRLPHSNGIAFSRSFENAYEFSSLSNVVFDRPGGKVYLLHVNQDFLFHFFERNYSLFSGTLFLTLEEQLLREQQFMVSSRVSPPTSYEEYLKQVAAKMLLRASGVEQGGSSNQAAVEPAAGSGARLSLLSTYLLQLALRRGRAKERALFVLRRALENKLSLEEWAHNFAVLNLAYRGVIEQNAAANRERAAGAAGATGSSASTAAKGSKPRHPQGGKTSADAVLEGGEGPGAGVGLAPSTSSGGSATAAAGRSIGPSTASGEETGPINTSGSGQKTVSLASLTSRLNGRTILSEKDVVLEVFIPYFEHCYGDTAQFIVELPGSETDRTARGDLMSQSATESCEPKTESDLDEESDGTRKTTQEGAEKRSKDLPGAGGAASETGEPVSAASAQQGGSTSSSARGRSSSTQQAWRASYQLDPKNVCLLSDVYVPGNPQSCLTVPCLRWTRPSREYHRREPYYSTAPPGSGSHPFPTPALTSTATAPSRTHQKPHPYNLQPVPIPATAPYLLQVVLAYLNSLLNLQILPHRILQCLLFDLCVYFEQFHLLQQLLHYHVLLDNPDLCRRLVSLVLQSLRKNNHKVEAHHAPSGLFLVPSSSGSTSCCAPDEAHQPQPAEEEFFASLRRNRQWLTQAALDMALRFRDFFTVADCLVLSEQFVDAIFLIKQTQLTQYPLAHLLDRVFRRILLHLEHELLQSDTGDVVSEEKADVEMKRTQRITEELNELQKKLLAAEPGSEGNKVLSVKENGEKWCRSVELFRYVAVWRSCLREIQLWHEQADRWKDSRAEGRGEDGRSREAAPEPARANCVVALQQESPDQLFVYGCCLGHAYAVVFLRHFLQLQGQMKARSLPDLRGVALNVPYPSPAVPHGFGLARFANKYVPTSVLSGVACVGQSFFKPLMQFSFCNSTAKMLKTVLAKEEKELFATSVGSASGDEEDCVLLAKELKGHAEAFARQEGAGDRGEGRSFFTVFGSSEKDQLTPGRAVRWLVTDVYAELGCDYEEAAPCSSHQLMVMGGGPVWNAPVHEKLLREKWGLI
eukprot:g11585.t1